MGPVKIQILLFAFKDSTFQIKLKLVIFKKFTWQKQKCIEKEEENKMHYNENCDIGP